MTLGEEDLKAPTQFRSRVEAGADIAVSPREDQVRAQLALILSSPIFSRSWRYPAFLEFVVEQTILDQHSNLKERIIGMKVFKRSSDYDTNEDPVVRVTAGEVRRRLAQYYQSNPDADVLISLPIGSYIPEFRLFENNKLDHADQITKIAPLLTFGVDELELEEEGTVHPATDWTAVPLQPEPLESPQGVRPRPKKLVVAGTVGLVLVGFILGFSIQQRFRRQPPKTALQQFWQPFGQLEHPALIVVGSVPALKNSSVQEDPEDLAHRVSTVDIIALDDADAVTRIVSEINKTAPSGRLQLSTHTTLQNLRNGPVVLVGAFDNAWTERVISTTPFRFFAPPGKLVVGIVDGNHPETKWMVDFTQSALAPRMDYAVVARLHDPMIDEDIIIAAGVGGAATSAAADFITNERYIDALVRSLPNNWSQRNVEVVIETQVIDGEPGKPIVLRTSIW
jgi:hypothetical protein